MVSPKCGANVQSFWQQLRSFNSGPRTSGVSASIGSPTYSKYKLSYQGSSTNDVKLLSSEDYTQLTTTI